MYHLKFILSPMNLFRENKRLQRVIDTIVNMSLRNAFGLTSLKGGCFVNV